MKRRPRDAAGILAGDMTSTPNAAWVLAATIIGSAMVFIDGSAVNVALPVMQADLHASAIALSWIVVGYALFLGSLMLAGGALGDRIGRKRIFVSGAVLFACASAACGLATSATAIVAARAVQGIGAAMLAPGSLSLLSASFDHERRAKAIGTWSAMTAISAVIGPALGGWLAQHASWRWVFFINLPLSIAVVAISLAKVPESRDVHLSRHVDWVGASLSTLGLGGFAYGLTFAPQLGWTNAGVLAGLISGVLLLAAFVFAERTERDPMLPGTLFASRTFTGANVLTFCVYAALSASLYFLPFKMIQLDGYSPTAAGVSLLPFVLIMFAMSPWSGALVSRIGARIPLVAGPAIVAVGFVMLGMLGARGLYWTTYFPGIVVFGVGMGLLVAPLTATVMNSVDEDLVGTASGVNNAVSRVAGLLAVAAGGSLMILMFSALLQHQLLADDIAAGLRGAVLTGRLALAATPIPSGLDAATHARIAAAIVSAYEGGYRVVMATCAALSALGAAIAAATIEK